MDMGFEDEKMITLRKEAYKKKYNSIETGIYVNNELIHFVESKLFDNSLRIMLPDNFIDMPLVMAKKKYISDQRPEIIKMNASGDVNITFSANEIVKVDSNELENISEGLKNILIRTQSTIEFFDEELIDNKKNTISKFAYKCYGIDEQIYNSIFIMSLNTSLMIGSFNCVFSEKDIWKPVLDLSIHSLNCLNEEK